MYQDIINHTHNYPQCAIVTGAGRRQLLPINLKSIAVDYPFQIIGVDIVEFPVTASGKYFKILYKWPIIIIYVS